MSCEHDHDMATASSVVPKVKLFGAPYSTCTSRVIMCLMEKQVDYDLQVVDIAKTQDHKKPEFLAMQVRLDPPFLQSFVYWSTFDRLIVDVVYKEVLPVGSDDCRPTDRLVYRKTY